MAPVRGKGGKSSNRPIETYEHKGKKRINNPPVGLVTPETDPVAPTQKTYDYKPPVPSVKPRQELDYDSHLDPQLVWAGKKEHSSFDVPTVSLHVNSRPGSGTVDCLARLRRKTFEFCYSRWDIDNCRRPNRFYWQVKLNMLEQFEGSQWNDAHVPFPHPTNIVRNAVTLDLGLKDYTPTTLESQKTRTVAIMTPGTTEH
jgi:hypothetical protein